MTADSSPGAKQINTQVGKLIKVAKKIITNPAIMVESAIMNEYRPGLSKYQFLQNSDGYLMNFTSVFIFVSDKNKPISKTKDPPPEWPNKCF